MTSAYHTRRTLGTFDKAFEGTPVRVGVVPAMPEQARPDRWWATPYDRHYVLYEWAAAVKYRWSVRRVKGAGLRGQGSGE